MDKALKDVQKRPTRMYKKDPPECTKKTLAIRRVFTYVNTLMKQKNILGLKEHCMQHLTGALKGLRLINIC